VNWEFTNAPMLDNAPYKTTSTTTATSSTTSTTTTTTASTTLTTTTTTYDLSCRLCEWILE
jgi:hypothetical protein